MRRLLFALLLVGCEDPAALEVRVTIEESGLVDVRPVVRKGTDLDAPKVLDCALSLDGEPEGLCPFEAGEGRWTDPDELVFVLYGEPSTELLISVDGRRQVNAAGETRLAVVTTTTALAALPPNPGERTSISLPLVDRTTPRNDCALDVGSELVTRDLSAIVPFGRAAPLTAVTAVGERLTLLRYLRDGDSGCTLEEVGVFTLPCAVHPNALVAGVLDRNGTVSVAGLCDEEARLFGGRVGGGMAPVFRELPLGMPRERVSRPAGTRSGQIVVVADEGQAVNLINWSPADGRLIRVPLDGVSFPVAPDGLSPAGPIILPPGPNRGVQTILIAGFGGAIGFVDRGQFRAIEQIDYTPVRGASAFTGDQIVLVDASADTIFFRELVPMPERDPPQVRVGATVRATIDPIDEARDVRVALGRFGADHSRYAVVTDGGLVQARPFDPNRMPAQFMATGAVDGAQVNLLWNMDGQPGAEIVTFDPGSNNLRGHTYDGLALDGWNPLSIDREDGEVRAALAHLALGPDDLELLTLSGGQVQVFFFGPSSVAVGDTGDWPQLSADGLATGVFIDRQVRDVPTVAR